MLELTPIFICLIVFGFIFGVIYISVRQKERRALLEKGADPAIFNIPKSYSATLRFGLLFVGVAIGILLGNILAVTTNLQEEAAYFSMIFLFGGLGLVINYFIEKKSRKEE